MGKCTTRHLFGYGGLKTTRGGGGGGGGGRAEASEGRVISESEHQKGRAIPHVSYSRKGHTSYLEFLTRIFVMLLSIFLTD